jgi:hypothetical protein
LHNLVRGSFAAKLALIPELRNHTDNALTDSHGARRSDNQFVCMIVELADGLQGRVLAEDCPESSRTIGTHYNPVSATNSDD